MLKLFYIRYSEIKNFNGKIHISKFYYFEFIPVLKRFLLVQPSEFSTLPILDSIIRAIPLNQ